MPATPLLALQTDGTAKLNSEEYFATISVKSVRAEQILSQIEQVMPHLTERAGKVGVGVLVGMPTITVEHQNPAGPQLMIVFPFRVQENPTINMDAATGTLKAAEEIAMQLLQTMHGFQIEGLCALYAAKEAIVPNTGFDGLVTYDVYLEALLPQSDLSKVVLPALAQVAGTQVQFTGVPAGSSVYWTGDLSFPGTGNAAAHLYAGGVLDLATYSLALPATVRWAAYKTGQIGSDAGQAAIT